MTHYVINCHLLRGVNTGAIPGVSGMNKFALRLNSYSVDRAAGLVWRCQDENNYYVVKTFTTNPTNFPEHHTAITSRISSRPTKSSAFRVYSGRPFAAAVEAISRSATRARTVRPAALVAAKTRAYIRAASASNGNGSQVAAAHCRRSCRSARSASSLVACGPAASSASVIAAIAVSSGSASIAMRSCSTTTDVSSRPLDASAICRLVYDRIQIPTQPVCVYASRGARRVCHDGPRYEPPRR